MNPLIEVALWSGASFQDMMKRHMIGIKKYPHAKGGQGIPYQGITNLCPESKETVKVFTSWHWFIVIAFRCIGCGRYGLWPAFALWHWFYLCLSWPGAYPDRSGSWFWWRGAKPTEFISFDNTSAVNNTVQLMADVWVLPFMNVFVVFGAIDGSAALEFTMLKVIVNTSQQL